MNSRSSRRIFTLFVILSTLTGCTSIQEKPTADTVGLDADKATNLHLEAERKIDTTNTLYATADHLQFNSTQAFYEKNYPADIGTMTPAVHRDATSTNDDVQINTLNIGIKRNVVQRRYFAINAGLGLMVNQAKFDIRETNATQTNLSRTTSLFSTLLEFQVPFNNSLKLISEFNIVPITGKDLLHYRTHLDYAITPSTWLQAGIGEFNFKEKGNHNPVKDGTKLNFNSDSEIDISSKEISLGLKFLF